MSAIRARLNPRARQWLIAAALVLIAAAPLAAQRRPAPQRPAPPRPAAPASPFGLRGVVHAGLITFQAQDSFEAVLDTRSGPIFGGGVQVRLPWNLYAEVGGSRFRQDGERVFVGPNREVFRLGIPTTITITPIEFTGGYRYRPCLRNPRMRTCQPSRFAAYGGGGLTVMRYEEVSDFAGPDENLNEWFRGFHVVGGADYQLQRWVAVGGEVAWSSVPDAFGETGAAAALGDDNLGGTTFRVKLTIGR